MRPLMIRFLAGVAPFWLSCGSLISQTALPPLVPPSRVEPGLEEAVNWKWSVAPSETKEWGLPLPDAPAPGAPDSPEAKPLTPAEPRPATYEVKKGDAIFKIARKFEMT